MILVVKRRTIVVAAVIIAGVIAFAAVVGLLTRTGAAGARKSDVTVVIDAGHGGIDGGVSGVRTGVKESDLNLAVAKKLRGFFNNAGVEVVMTRENSGGLYGLTSVSRKMRDMEKRREIIESADPDIIISIHMNAYPQSKQRGAQVFYERGNGQSLELAENIRSMVSGMLPCSDRAALSGDYYIIECTPHPAVIVECGFLSNPEDEALLITSEYQEKVAYAVFCGAALFLKLL